MKHLSTFTVPQGNGTPFEAVYRMSGVTVDFYLSGVHCGESGPDVIAAIASSMGYFEGRVPAIIADGEEPGLTDLRAAFERALDDHWTYDGKVLSLNEDQRAYLRGAFDGAFGLSMRVINNVDQQYRHLDSRWACCSCDRGFRRMAHGSTTYDLEE